MHTIRSPVLSMVLRERQRVRTKRRTIISARRPLHPTSREGQESCWQVLTRHNDLEKDTQDRVLTRTCMRFRTCWHMHLNARHASAHARTHTHTHTHTHASAYHVHASLGHTLASVPFAAALHRVLLRRLATVTACALPKGAPQHLQLVPRSVKGANLSPDARQPDVKGKVLSGFLCVVSFL